MVDETPGSVELPNRTDKSGRDRADTLHGRPELDRSSRDDSVIDDRQVENVTPAKIQDVQDNRNDNAQEEFEEEQNEEVKVFDTYQPRQTIKGTQPHPRQASRKRSYGSGEIPEIRLPAFTSQENIKIYKRCPSRNNHIGRQFF